MIASVHLADVGAPRAISAVPRAPKPAKVDGLRGAHALLGGHLGGSAFPRPNFARLGLIAFWDDDAAIDRFEATHPFAERVARGFSCRLAPLRAYGSWPGLPADTPAGRSTGNVAPVAAITIAKVRVSQVVRFLKTSAPAENRVLEADGLLFATALASPPTVATFSLWESTSALSAYAYGHDEPRHAEAIAEQRRKDFHRQSAFIRFRPFALKGSVEAMGGVSAAAPADADD